MTNRNIAVYYLDKLITDDKMETLKNTKVKKSMINLIINEDADVYTKDNKLLLKFRTKKLPENNVKLFYDNIINFAKTSSTNRAIASGNIGKSIGSSEKIMTNVIGYFDIWGPTQKKVFRENGMKLPLEVRETFFNVNYPEKYKNTIPLIQNVNDLYKKNLPLFFDKQRKLANQTPFKIENNVFTTVTTNINFQTRIHKDKGDFSEGFGNLIVIENGNYLGGETCFPQYGVGVNVRTGDILFMNVHEYHGNLPIIKKTPDAIRLSIVCYLRHRIWLRTKGKTRKFMISHNAKIKRILKNTTKKK